MDKILTQTSVKTIRDKKKISQKIFKGFCMDYYPRQMERKERITFR